MRQQCSHFASERVVLSWEVFRTYISTLDVHGSAISDERFITVSLLSEQAIALFALQTRSEEVVEVKESRIGEWGAGYVDLHVDQMFMCCRGSLLSLNHHYLSKFVIVHLLRTR